MKSCRLLLLIQKACVHVLKLVEKSPFEGLLPISFGGFTFIEEDIEYITSIARIKGKVNQLSSALKKTHGMALPGANRMTGREGARCVWLGQQYLLLGPKPDQSLFNSARLTDVSDGYAVVRAVGPDIEKVLARLTPVNVSPSVFKRGQTARTLIHHLTGSLSRISDKAFQIIVARSMALTLVRDMERATQSVIARDQI